MAAFTEFCGHQEAGHREPILQARIESWLVSCGAGFLSTRVITLEWLPDCGSKILFRRWQLPGLGSGVRSQQPKSVSLALPMTQ